ncbi:MAG TPA: hypothetical protein VMH27_21820 [Puia sp.]|nr:hypothetical protein [Puia sp.]
MLRHYTAILLLLAFGASSFSKAVIVVNFYANQDYIAKNLCENRDRPIMHCCGRCQLRKRLNREADQDKNNAEQRADNKQEVLYFDESTTVLAPQARNYVDFPYSRYFDGDPIDRAADIFHPPAWRALS